MPLHDLVNVFVNARYFVGAGGEDAHAFSFEVVFDGLPVVLVFRLPAR